MATFNASSTGGTLNGSAQNDTLNGSSVADQLYGLNGNDTINGNAGNDQLYGGDGNDNLYGGSGDDLLSGGSGNDLLDGGSGNDLLLGDTGNDQNSGGAGSDTIDYSLSPTAVTVSLLGVGSGGFAAGDTWSGIEIIVGSAYNDRLTGDIYDNTLIGGAGADFLSGGLGGVDTASYVYSNAGVTINLGTNVATGGDAQGDTFSSIENLVGSALNDTLTGDASANTITGGDGNDVVDGGTGNDIIYGGNGDDTLTGNYGTDKMYGGAGNDTMLAEWDEGNGDYYDGGDGIDTYKIDGTAVQSYALQIDLANGTSQYKDKFISIENLIGGQGNDVFYGDAGVNELSGRDGNDTIDGRAGNDYVAGDNGDDTLAGGDGDDVVDGGAGKDSLSGGAGNDQLIGGAGADALIGGDGTDVADYSASSAGVTVNLKAGTGLGGDAAGDTLSGIENVTGSAFNDVFVSAAGANVLNGGAGVDTVDFTGSTAAVTVNLDSGNGLGGTAEGDTFAGVENVLGTQWADVLTGNADGNRQEGFGGDDTLHGLAGNDQLFGGSGNDRIYGGEGADLVDGGSGIDTADYRYSAAGVSVSLVTNTGTGGDAEGDVLVSIENLAGSEFDDVLTGNDGNNRIVGGMGSDKLYGGAGDDRFDTGGGYDFVDGGAGIDAVTYDDSWGAVVVNLATGVGSGAEAAGDTYLNLEDVTGSLFNDKITGNAGVNFLVGLDGNDVLDGGAGNDYLVGGLGADTLIGGAGDQDVADYDDAAAGVAVNLVTGGTGGEAAGDTYSGIEYVYGSAFNDTIVGNDAVNRLLGNDGNDVLDGGAGNDVLIGGQGADTLIGGAGDQDAASYQDAQLAVIVNLALGGSGGDAAGDTYSGIEYVYGSAFNDQIIGDGAINRLVGGAGNDYLDGAGGNDYLLGDAGNDMLVGGAGADVFVFNAGFGDDTISDFWAGVGRTDRAWFQGVSGIANYADVLSHAADSAVGVVISVAGQGSLTLSGLTIAQLNADDFLFG